MRRDQKGRFMIDAVTNQIVLTAVATVAGAVVGLMLSQAKALTRRQKAQDEILKALARKSIVDAHADYVVGGEPMTIERYDEVSRLYGAYRAMGGNGTGERLYKEIQQVCPYVVTGAE